jgi:hypothetical protein
VSTEIDGRLRINVRRLLEFFDEKPGESLGQATAIVAVAGEDLGVGLLKHCLECTRNAKVGILPGPPPTTGNLKGPRLDRWVDVVWPDGSGRLFQTEIKNWSAHAIGGKILKVDAPPDEVARFAVERWGMHAGAMYTWRAINKVLTPMKRPSGVDPSHTLEPLLIYWTVIHPEGLNESFFSHDLEPGQNFPRLWFFSMSSYLRSLNEAAIELEMPHAANRISWLHRLFPAQ